jgi:segregation and condensation protein B
LILDDIELLKAIEAILFVADEPLTVHQLSRVAEVTTAEVESCLGALTEACRMRGVRVQRNLEAFQLVSAPEAAPYIDRLLGSGSERRLSGAALEVLAIVAYKQPITRAGVEAIRGVNSDRTLRTLQTLNLIVDTGRMDTVGRPVLFGTTFDFLQHFGLESLKDLPPVEQLTDASGGALAQQLPLPGNIKGRLVTDGHTTRRRQPEKSAQSGSSGTE